MHLKVESVKVSLTIPLVGAGIVMRVQVVE
ncbi:MAG: hypothetical protein DDT19_01135 [Syntrophomonadaceae bacterium]|nr:hypothetical protein [Bacillota bacterium]